MSTRHSLNTHADPHSAHFDVVVESETHIVLIDRDEGRSITNDADGVIKRLQALLAGGIGNRRVVYLDTTRHFDELRVENRRFVGFAPCTASQQEYFAEMVSEQDPSKGLSAVPSGPKGSGI